MDYHKDRFDDFSLLVFKKEKLVSVMPANVKDRVVYSHTGLTYGGILLHKEVKFNEAWEIYRVLFQYLSENKIEACILKEIPTIYTTYPSDEFSYLMFILKGKLIRTDVSSSIPQQERLKIQANRIEGVKKAAKANLVIKEEAMFEDFWNKILIPNLAKRHEALPVHSLSEISLLQKAFPENIKQFNVYQENTIVGGATIFETKKVAHVQYISANEQRQELGALDFLFHYLIMEKYLNKSYFDFGISNENQGNNLNQGLLYWKECFGARTIVHQHYEIETAHYRLMDTVFL
ncbi:MAG: GNAT family N-acetyltransferase [Flavobacteriaceae bacterium]